jgi:hypothetical protein
MRALKGVRQLIERDPNAPQAVLLTRLVLALEGDQGFDVKDLYELDYDAFELALKLLQEWRLNRFYSAKFRLMDVSVAAQDLQRAP